ncbi:MAG: hypothetical protein IT350_17170 [Deltaproteobacteria bacterium]|nr:hypothetical protein [Deltaproteobacteria bacterium]
MKAFWMLLLTASLMLAAGSVVACGDDDDDDDDDAADDDADDDTDDDADDDAADDDDAACTPESMCEITVECDGFASVDECMGFSESYWESCAEGYTDCLCACGDAYNAGGSCEEFSPCGTECFTNFCV